MGASILHASIKKIEILNKTRKDHWVQSVQILLADIELNNENLVALRKFRPDEVVHVVIESAQMSLFDKRSAGAIYGEGKQVSVEEEGVVIVDESEAAQDETVEREFRF